MKYQIKHMYDMSAEFRYHIASNVQASVQRIENVVNKNKHK